MFFHHPLVLALRSAALSSLCHTASVLCWCDQLGGINPTDIPGDRASGGHALLHVSSSSLPSVSPLHTWLSCHSCSTSLSSTTFFSITRANNRPHSFAVPSQSRALIPYCSDSDGSDLAFSPAFLGSSVLCTSGCLLTVMHLTSSPLPSLLQLNSTLFFFSSPFAFLYLALSRLLFTMTDRSSLLYANHSPVS